MKICNCKRVTLLITFVFILSTILAGCGNGNNESEQSGKAVLDQVLNCSLQEAEEFDALLKEITAGVETGNETGISLTGDRLKDYFKERFGDSMTDECLEQIMADRMCSLSMILVKQYASDITAEEIQFKKRSGEQEIFDFTAKLVTATDNTQIADVTGNITMVSDEATWKASNLTIKVKNVGN